GGARAPLAKALEILEREVEATQVGEGVLEHAGVPGAEHEAIAVAPGGVGWIEAEDVPVERVGQRRQGHRRSGVSGAGLLDRIHRQASDRVDRELAYLMLAVREGGGEQTARLGDRRHISRS